MGEGGGLRRIFELQSATIPERDDQTSQPPNLVEETLSAAENEDNKVKVDMTADFDINFADYGNSSKDQQVFNQVRVIRGFDESYEESVKNDPRIARLYKGIRNVETFVALFIPLPFDVPLASVMHNNIQ
jgi:hypothetical protein